MLDGHRPHHMMNQMVSMVGPMMMSHGIGSQTGLGMQEGMGMLRQGNALSEDFGPGMGRGMGITTAEKPVSNIVAQQEPAQTGFYVCPMHPEVISNKPGSCPKCNMKLVRKQQTAVTLTEEEKKKVPGYPQDMMMVVDDDVVKPETWGLVPGWSASLMGMMTLVRVLPDDKYNKIMAMIKEGRTEKPKSSPDQHKHGE